MNSFAAEYPRPAAHFVIAGVCLMALALVAAMQPVTAPAPTQDAVSPGPPPP